MASPLLPRIRARPHWLDAALIFGATLLAYLPCLRGGLIWDDDGHVTAPELRSWHGLGRIWSEIGATQQYYPLLHTAFWIEHRLWGDSTLGYHLLNILLHATSACLLVAILRRLAVPGAVLAGFIFALHPIGVESVAWISEQKNTLSGVFYFLAALTYLKYAEVGRGVRAEPRLTEDGSPYLYWLATAFFICALLSKTVTATLPAALLVVLWWKRGRLSWRADVRPLIPWFVLGIAAGLGTAVLERTTIGARGGAFELSLLQRCLLAGRVIWFYLGKDLWPANLIFIYPRWMIDASAWRQYLCPIAWLALLAAGWRLARGIPWGPDHAIRRWRGPLAALLFLTGTLFPALGFFNVYPFRFSFVADHFQYLACLGVIVPVAAGLVLALERAPVRTRPSVRAAIFGLVAVLALLSARQSRLYSDVETLYRTTLARNPTCWMAYNNLGVLLVRDPARHAEAVELLRAALRLNPDYAEAHNNFGNTLLKLGQDAAAIDQYQAALRLNPGWAVAQDNLANVLALVGRFDEAVGHYEEALRLDPKYAGAHNNFGNALMQAGRLGEAEAQLETALRLNPDYLEARVNLGLVLGRLGRPEEAIAQFEAALRIDPNEVLAHFGLANLLVEKGRSDEAIAHYASAVRLDPNYPDARVNFGILLGRLGRTGEAIAQFEGALRINPESGDTHFNLANALVRENRVEEAIGHYESAVRIKPDDLAAENNLAVVLARVGRTREAVAHLTTALRYRPDSAVTRANLERIEAMAAGPGP